MQKNIYLFHFVILTKDRYKIMYMLQWSRRKFFYGSEHL